MTRDLGGLSHRSSIYLGKLLNAILGTFGYEGFFAIRQTTKLRLLAKTIRMQLQ
jgi:hypothetical protein